MSAITSASAWNSVIGLADEFAFCVAEQVAFGFVRPEDRAVGANFVQAFHRVFEEVGQLSLALAQRLFDFASVLDFGFERLGLLLQ